MYGNVITSNGSIKLEKDETKKEIVLDKTIYHLNIVILNNCHLYLNDSSDFISIETVNIRPFEIKGIPIYKFTIQKNARTFYPLSFSYYGFY